MDRIRMARPKRTITMRELVRDAVKVFQEVRQGTPFLVIRRSRPVAVLCPLPEEWFGAQPNMPRVVEEPSDDDVLDGDLR
jgi:antitoxin (DNA-binding transcriptional repressor) of toxin-antitoxin stability system